MFAQSFECPSCGAPMKQSTPAARTLVCAHCGQTSHLNAESLEAVGDQHLLIDYGSRLAIGQTGRYFGREFMVLGRLRIDYEDGFWDEWYIQFLDNGETGWIQEDDGSFVLFTEAGRLRQRLNLDGVKVGSFVPLTTDMDKVFITSKSKASVNGGEGELPFRIIPGQQADFVDGILDGEVISVELLAEDNVLFRGKPLELEELELSY
jgi:hypothetical protein